jgi:hypothetical protein
MDGCWTVERLSLADYEDNVLPKSHRTGMRSDSIYAVGGWFVGSVLVISGHVDWMQE